jgi:hypothetical protein
MTLAECVVLLLLDLFSLASGFFKRGIGSPCMLRGSFRVGLYSLKRVVKPTECSFCVRYLAVRPENLMVEGISDLCLSA